MKFFRHLRQHGLRIVASLSVVLLFVLHSTQVIDIEGVGRLENYLYDLRLRQTMPNGIDKRIVIVDIDEKSLQGIGQWPWPRQTVSRLVDRLFDHYQIGVLGFDVVFAEPEQNPGLAALESLAENELRHDAAFQAAFARQRREMNFDQRLAASFHGRPVVLGYVFRHDGDPLGIQGGLPPAIMPTGSFSPDTVGAVRSSGYTANQPELQQAAAGGGFFNASPLVDADGVFRRISLLQEYHGGLYETLGLAVARLALRETSLGLIYDTPQPEPYALKQVRLGGRRIPVDSELGVLIPYRGQQGSFPYVSAIDVLQGKASAPDLKDAIVLVGTTADGLKDLRSMPMQNQYAGVEAHANVVAGILDGTIKERPAYVTGLETVAILFFGFLLALLLPLLNPLWATLFSLAILSGIGGGNYYLWANAHLALPLATLLLMVLVVLVLNMAYGFFVEARGKRLLAGRFGQYVPPELVDKMARDPSSYTLASESRELTVLFADIRGFTSISEAMSPQALSDLMNAYLTAMTEVIQRHRGTIDKYMGDAIMAFWGAPMSDPQHARQGLLASLEMIAVLAARRADFQARGWPELRIGVGLNTGMMTVGNMGSSFRMAYTAMGDAVNLGSRLEGLTKEYGVQIIVSQFTRAQVPEFAYRELDLVRVKGKDEPVAIYEPIGLESELDTAARAALATYHQALDDYRARHWQAAAEAFSSLAAADPERAIFGTYLERIRHFQSQPPAADWDGVFVWITK